MQPTVIPKPRQIAKREIVQQVEQGVSAQQARGHSTVPMHRTTVYRLLKRVQREGESGFTDGRHGHPVKLRGEVLLFLKEHCQSHASVSSSAVQGLLHEHFGLFISVSQLNRVRAALGVSRQRVQLRKKSQKPASRLSQDTTNRQVVCCCWPRLPRQDCSRSWSKPCQPQQPVLIPH